MYRLLPLLGDVGLGFLSIVIVSVCYGRYEPTALWLMPFAFLPDLDALAEVRRKGRVAASAENPHDHCELFHKPLIWLVLLALLWWFWGYYGAIAFVMILMHFLHDSVLTGWGVPWLAPFSDVRFKFFVNERNEESLARKDWMRTWDARSLKEAIVAHGNANWIEDLYLHVTVVSVTEYSIFLVSLIALAVLSS